MSPVLNGRACASLRCRKSPALVLACTSQLAHLQITPRLDALKWLFICASAALRRSGSFGFSSAPQLSHWQILVFRRKLSHASRLLVSVRAFCLHLRRWRLKFVTFLLIQVSDFPMTHTRPYLLPLAFQTANLTRIVLRGLACWIRPILFGEGQFNQIRKYLAKKMLLLAIPGRRQMANEA